MDAVDSCRPADSGGPFVGLDALAMPKGCSQLSGLALTEKVQWYAPPRRKHSKRELLADRCVNVLGAGAAWPLSAILCAASVQSGHRGIVTFGFVAFGVGFIGMLNFSAFYHYRAWDWPHAQQLVSLDYSGISLMIMGCYAPVMIAGACYRCLALNWSLGFLGFAMEIGKHCAQREGHESAAGQWTTFDFIHLARFLVMGWVPALLALGSLRNVFDRSEISLIVAGGALYTLGVPMLLRGSMEFHLSIWHAFVLCASMCFYALFWSMAH